MKVRGHQFPVVGTHEEAEEGGTYIPPQSAVYYNNDYMNNNAYLSYSPKTKQYTEYNNDKKVTDFSSNLDCGDCLRGDFIYCTQSFSMGSSYDDIAPAGTCCADSASCAEQYNPQYNCSSSYFDNHYQY